ncbi:hypothetical protein ACFSOZ_03470 [Mesorhizobium newzealandense]|uniref:Uncharacterized protein n=3 Tax=Mesorhizobium TaxID=68287 RepID=A0ABW4WEN7_9HYPH|nr:hypothetical protein [Mesorhizobium sophorae]
MTDADRLDLSQTPLRGKNGRLSDTLHPALEPVADDGLGNDLVDPATITIEADNHAEIAFGALQAGLDLTYGAERSSGLFPKRASASLLPRTVKRTPSFALLR